jgi:hypothetical protein
MSRALLPVAMLLAFGVIKLPAERVLALRHRQHDVTDIANLDCGERLGQLGFVAALSGLRAVVADFLFIQAHEAWERTEWARVLFLFRQVTTLQPQVPLFWEMAAWHMAWNASAAVMNDTSQPRLGLRVKAEREYFALGKDFLERGITNNPNSAQLYETLARFYRDKLNDHAQASQSYAKAATLSGAHNYDRRFSAYELSYCEGRELEAYERLRALYEEGEHERLPTLIRRLKFLESKLNLPQGERIPDKEG